MKISLRFPKEQHLLPWLQARKQDRYSYPEHRATLQDVFPKGYNHDRNTCLLGVGDHAFEAAKEAINQWVMFPKPWTHIFPAQPFVQDKEVVVLFRLFGLWWFNSSRVIYTINEPHRYGFAYGTLTQHVEKGEELFLVEQDAEGKVWYRLEAFSQPRAWYVRLFKPLARYHQKRFGRQSKAAMQAFVNQYLAKNELTL
jgi:uncharacterized protein (UPF0548 family)